MNVLKIFWVILFVYGAWALVPTGVYGLCGIDMRTDSSHLALISGIEVPIWTVFAALIVGLLLLWIDKRPRAALTSLVITLLIYGWVLILIGMGQHATMGDFVNIGIKIPMWTTLVAFVIAILLYFISNRFRTKPKPQAEPYDELDPLHTN